MNLDLANDFMYGASKDISKSWYFIVSMLSYCLLELVAPCFVCCCLDSFRALIVCCCKCIPKRESATSEHIVYNQDYPEEGDGPEYNIKNAEEFLV